MVANAAIAHISEIVDREYDSVLTPGAASQVLSVPTVDVEAFDRSLAVNVRGVMLCYKYAARQMIKQGNGGRILGRLSSHIVDVTHDHPHHNISTAVLQPCNIQSPTRSDVCRYSETFLSAGSVSPKRWNLSFILTSICSFERVDLT